MKVRHLLDGFEFILNEKRRILAVISFSFPLHDLLGGICARHDTDT